jgi:hypothetical protein
MDEFVVTVAGCPDCRVSAGNRCEGPVCRQRRSAALERYMASPPVPLLPVAPAAAGWVAR